MALRARRFSSLSRFIFVGREFEIADRLSALVTSMPGVILSQFEMHTSASAMRALHMYSMLSAMIGFGPSGSLEVALRRATLKMILT